MAILKSTHNNSFGLLTNMEAFGNITPFNYDNNKNIVEKNFKNEIIDTYKYDKKTNFISLFFPKTYKKINS